MNDALKTPLAAAGRVLLALIFITSGFSKLGNLDGTAGYIASVGLPAGGALALGAGLLEVVAGLALAIGFKARWAALALGVFTIVAALLFHRYWAMPEQQQFMQQLLFMKNLAIAGGMFIVASLGAGAASIDARLARA
jgi:putative oxidoreductase